MNTSETNIMNTPLKKYIRITAFSLGALAITIAGLFFAIVQPGGSGVLASIRLPDGSEYMVTQQCNWSVEPYTVSFYMRSADGPWGWCYIDHEAARWRDVGMTYDAATDTVAVTERGTWQAALDRKHSNFSVGHGKPNRDVDAPQNHHQPKFAFR